MRGMIRASFFGIAQEFPAHRGLAHAEFFRGAPLRIARAEQRGKRNTVIAREVTVHRDGDAGWFIDLSSVHPPVGAGSIRVMHFSAEF